MSAESSVSAAVLSPEPTAPGNSENWPAIAVRGLQKRYGKLTAVRGIDFTVERGEVFGLIGPDGAGKTTTFHILAGIMAGTAGQVEIAGQLAYNFGSSGGQRSMPRTQAQEQVGYLTQQFSLYLDLSIDENLRYIAGLREVPEEVFHQRRSKYLQLMGLEQFGERLAGQLSGGMKQKLALCCALVAQPQILLLDEPTTGVDPLSRREFWDVLATLADEGVTIVVATPYLDEAERCHRIALMYAGQIQQIGTLKSLRASLGLQRLEVWLQDVALLESASQVLLSQDEFVDHPRIERVDPSTQQAASAIADVQTFGDRLDVLIHPSDRAESEVRQRLEQQQIAIAAIEPSIATLENVFVARLRQQGSDPPFMPLPRAAQGRQQLTQGIAIGATRLRKVFGDFTAVKGVDLEVRYGEIYGLLGANGAGKTTTIKMLCGLLQASSGRIALAGQTQNLRSSDLRRRIGYMSQKFTLYDDLSIVQNLEFYCGIYGVPRALRRDKIAWVLTTCGLMGQENLVTGQLPQGWKQRVAFGASVMHEPEILFLDEPTSGVDPLARRQFWRFIEDLARAGTAVLVTTHYLEEAEHCNRMGFMVAGEVVTQGSPSQIKAAQPGQLLELVTDPIQLAANLLKTQVDAWRVSIFGDRLHLVLDQPEAELPRLQTGLAEAGITVRSLRPIPFSLEDAFIGIVQRANAQKPS